MPGMSGPNEQWPLEVKIARTVWPTVDLTLTESFVFDHKTDVKVLTVRGHKDDVNRVLAAIQPVLAEMGMLASGGVVHHEVGDAE